MIMESCLFFNFPARFWRQSETNTRIDEKWKWALSPLRFLPPSSPRCPLGTITHLEFCTPAYFVFCVATGCFSCTTNISTDLFAVSGVVSIVAILVMFIHQYLSISLSCENPREYLCEILLFQQFRGVDTWGESIRWKQLLRHLSALPFFFINVNLKKFM